MKSKIAMLVLLGATLAGLHLSASARGGLVQGAWDEIIYGADADGTSRYSRWWMHYFEGDGNP